MVHRSTLLAANGISGSSGFSKEWRLALAYARGRNKAVLRSDVAPIKAFLLNSTFSYGFLTH